MSHSPPLHWSIAIQNNEEKQNKHHMNHPLIFVRSTLYGSTASKSIFYYVCLLCHRKTHEERCYRLPTSRENEVIDQSVSESTCCDA